MICESRSIGPPSKKYIVNIKITKSVASPFLKGLPPGISLYHFPQIKKYKIITHNTPTKKKGVQFAQNRI